MAIDRLSSTAALIATMRALGPRRGEAGKRVGAPRGDAAPQRAEGHRDIAALRGKLVDLVRNESLDDLETLRRMRSVVVRTILLWELGSQLREHPDWQPMLESIVSALEANPAQVRAFSKLLAELQRSGGKA